eukprot:700955-Hanusia_phi.AAC.1
MSDRHQSCKDKKLRAALASHIVSDIKNINTGKKDNKTNKELQNFLFKLLSDRNSTAAKCSLDVLIKVIRPSRSPGSDKSPAVQEENLV